MNQKFNDENKKDLLKRGFSEDDISYLESFNYDKKDLYSKICDKLDNTDFTPTKLITELKNAIKVELKKQNITEEETKPEIMEEPPKEIMEETKPEIVEETPKEIIEETKPEISKEIIEETKPEIIEDNQFKKTGGKTYKNNHKNKHKKSRKGGKSRKDRKRKKSRKGGKERKIKNQDTQNRKYYNII